MNKILNAANSEPIAISILCTLVGFFFLSQMQKFAFALFVYFLM